ncbi:hypothetical protein [Anabaena lutea]|uniref:Uncharacterized protein n=1 Tax=Anabaena lutea FACHB-196 TaxID=2692881 RepID=A0ABR8FIT5_9NOST|nr:hypothetical protein [Anabaena lutea]MBD2569691.1 hypothetical protein [Anabaena lutea FACHB-196]
MSSQLILPKDYRDLLFVSAPDERSIQGMLTINQASVDWLQGKIDTGTYFDILDEYGVDPFDHVEPVEDILDGQLSPLLLP